MSAMPEFQTPQFGGESRPVSTVAAQLQPKPEPKKKGKGKVLVIALLLVVVLGGGYFAKSKLLKPPEYAKGQPVPNGSVFSLGTVTVNTVGGQYAQAAIVLQLTKPASEKVVGEQAVELKNAAIGDISGWTYTRLLHPATRVALQRQLLVSFQKILGTVDGAAQQVSAVYFTNFIVQQ